MTLNQLDPFNWFLAFTRQPKFHNIPLMICTDANLARSMPIASSAAKTLVNYEMDSLEMRLLVAKPRERRDTISQEARRMHGILKKAVAAGNETNGLYKQATSNLEWAKKCLTGEKRQEPGAEFFERIEARDA
jgi:hypothetical protein